MLKMQLKSHNKVACTYIFKESFKQGSLASWYIHHAYASGLSADLHCAGYYISIMHYTKWHQGGITNVEFHE